MWPFKKKPAPVKAPKTPRPIENPVLETAMFRHRMTPSEQTVQDVAKALQSATYLAPIKGDRIALAQDGNSTVIQPGSVIEFMLCLDTQGTSFIPVFTSWSELRKWAGDNAEAWVQQPSEVWSRALNASTPMGVVINPANMPWTLGPEHIRNLIAESK